MIRALLLPAVVALSACGTPDAPVTVAPPSAADIASAAYATCVDKAAAAVDLAADQPATLIARVMKTCRDARAEVVAKVAAAQVAAGKNAATAAALAEKAVRVADSELRDRANTVIVRAKLKAS